MPDTRLQIIARTYFTHLLTDSDARLRHLDAVFVDDASAIVNAINETVIVGKELTEDELELVLGILRTIATDVKQRIVGPFESEIPFSIGVVRGPKGGGHDGGGNDDGH